MSEFFPHKRGCTQGDPLSQSFMCRRLLTGVKKNINIKRIVIDNKEMKISQYANDTQILLYGTE